MSKTMTRRRGHGRSKTPPGQRERMWNTISTVLLVLGAVVTAYLVFLALTRTY